MARAAWLGRRSAGHEGSGGGRVGIVIGTRSRASRRRGRYFTVSVKFTVCDTVPSLAVTCTA